MRQRLYEYLTQHPSGATSSELLRLLFPAELSRGQSPGRPPEFSARILNAVLGPDPHFSYDSTTDRWSLATQNSLHQSALSATFTVIDLETTGLKPGAAGITEIAAIRVENGRFSEEFHTLLNPGRRIPPMITQLTGISDDMVHDQPRIDNIFSQFHTFLGSTVLVAHNADFDVNFLNFDSQRLSSSPLLDRKSVV